MNWIIYIVGNCEISLIQNQGYRKWDQKVKKILHLCCRCDGPSVYGCEGGKEGGKSWLPHLTRVFKPIRKSKALDQNVWKGRTDTVLYNSNIEGSGISDLPTIGCSKKYAFFQSTTSHLSFCNRCKRSAKYTLIFISE